MPHGSEHEREYDQGTMAARYLVSTGDAARAVGVSGATITRWVHSGKITPAVVTAGGHFRWDLDALRAQISADPADPQPADPITEAAAVLDGYRRSFRTRGPSSWARVLADALEAVLPDSAPGDLIRQATLAAGQLTRDERAALLGYLVSANPAAVLHAIRRLRANGTITEATQSTE